MAHSAGDVQRQYQYRFLCDTLPTRDEIPGLDSVNFAHEEIGDKHHQIAQLIKRKESIPPPLLRSLGVHPSDKDACLKMRDLCHFLAGGEYVVLPSKDAGVFYVFEENEKIKLVDFLADESKSLHQRVIFGDLVPKALFKVGRKRAQLELVIRRIATLMKLQEHTVFGMFAALKFSKLPPFWSGDNSMTEDLWNGDSKRFDQSSENGQIVGILEPFIPSVVDRSSKHQSLLNFARLTVLAICIGLRDAGAQNIISGKVFIDVEECFPERLDPDPDQKWARAAHNLTYLLDEPLCKVPLPLEILEEVCKIVLGIDVFNMASNLSRVNKIFVDSYQDETDVSEFEQIEEDDLDRGDISFDDEEEMIYEDEGGCKVCIDEYVEEPNPLFPRNRSRKVFTKAQCSTFTERVIKLQRILGKKRLHLQRATTEGEFDPKHSISCLDMVEMVDPFFAFQRKIFKRGSDVGRTPSPCPRDVVAELKSPLPLVNRDFDDLLRALELNAESTANGE